MGNNNGNNVSENLLTLNVLDELEELIDECFTGIKDKNKKNKEKDQKVQKQDTHKMII